MTSENTSSRILTGWKEIADYLGVEKTTAQRWEKENRLPVQRLPGKKGRVLASTEDLDLWRQQGYQASRESEPVPILATETASPAEAEQNQATTVATTVEPEAAGQETGLGLCEPAKTEINPLPTASYAHHRSGYRPLWWLIGFLLAGAAVTGALVFTSQGDLADFHVQGKNLIALDTKGRQLWLHTFRAPLTDWPYQATAKPRWSWLGLLPPEQQPSLVFASKPIRSSDSSDEALCFSTNGHVRWTFTPGHGVADRGGSLMLPPYWINCVQVVSGRQAADTRIIISSNHYLQQAEQIASLDVRGQLVGEYWHPGHLLHLAEADLGKTGRTQLLAGGVNNGYHSATLVVLDPLKIIGRTTPVNLPDGRFELVGMQSAHEQAVVLFPRSDVSKNEPYTRVANLWATTNRIIVQVAEGTNEDTSPRLVYELDHGLHVVNVQGTDNFRRVHKTLESTGQLNHVLTQAELDQLKSAVVIQQR